MRIHINIEDSKYAFWIKTTRTNWNDRFDQLCFWIYALWLIFVSFFLTYSIFKIEWSESLRSAIILSLIVGVILIGLISIFTVMTFNKLFKIAGVDRKMNERIFQQVLLEKFGHKPSIAGDILKIYRQPTLWRMGKRVIVIFDDKNVLINIATFNFRHIRSPIHGLFDWLQILKFKRRFLLKVQNSGA